MTAKINEALSASTYVEIDGCAWLLLPVNDSVVRLIDRWVAKQRRLQRADEQKKLSF